jgi:PRTRC genetic system protein A
MSTTPSNPADIEAFRNLVMSQEAHLVGVPDHYEHLVNYVYTEEGAFQINCRPFANFTAKLERVKGGKHRKIEEGIEFTHSRIPFQFLQRAHKFFRLALAAPRRSEALYMILWNMERQEYVEYVPRQYDGPGHAKEADSTERPADCILVAHIHSHPTFAGRFSGIDDGDDRRCSDGAIFGVIGHVDLDNPDMQWRASVNGKYVPLNPKQIFTSPLTMREVAEDVPLEWLQQIQDPPPREKDEDSFCKPDTYHSRGIRHHSHEFGTMSNGTPLETQRTLVNTNGEIVEGFYNCDRGELEDINGQYQWEDRFKHF